LKNSQLNPLPYHKNRGEWPPLDCFVPRNDGAPADALTVVLLLVEMVVDIRKLIAQISNVPQIAHALQNHIVTLCVMNASNIKLSSWSTLGNLPWRITSSAPNPLRPDSNHLTQKECVTNHLAKTKIKSKQTL